MPAVSRHSAKRDAILSALRETTCHPSAEWVYLRLKPEHPDLSLGTVYRNLALFRRRGDICSVGTVDGQERFDANTGVHAHFICEKCSSVLDMDASLVPRESYSELTAQYGFSPRTHTLTFYGLCQDCVAQEKEA
ncbi:MAG: transcriptional repressor [Oscillospiraceae bacterium]|nr:transcriptional repressor [Oscillospiraceae bacterium]